MKGIGDRNEEQLQMMLMALKDTKHGICIFQAQEQSKWAEVIQQKMGTENVILHNIADDCAEDGMITSKSFRRWASLSDAGVVIIYNLQLLGLRFGDEEAVQKLNYMRDQVQSIGKLFVLGVSPYFNLMLSRYARDLYSCILYHFQFTGTEDWNHIFVEDSLSLSGDSALEAERYRECRERIANAGKDLETRVYVEFLDSWESNRDHLLHEEEQFALKIVKKVEERYSGKEVSLGELDDIYILALAWVMTGYLEKGLHWYEYSLDLVKRTVGDLHEMYAVALIESNYYFWKVSDFEKCEANYDQAIAIYEQSGKIFSAKCISAKIERAVLYRKKGRYEEALKTYEEVLRFYTGKYGENYLRNALLLNNAGRVYEESQKYSAAMDMYEKALKIAEESKNITMIVALHINISAIYLKSGEFSEAWRAIKKAKRLTEAVYGSSAKQLVSIYNMMSGIEAKRNRQDKELDYLQKAEKIIKERNMEEQEDAAYVYHNIGNFKMTTYNYGIAAMYYQKAVNTRRKIYASDNLLLATSYVGLGLAFYKLHRIDESRENLHKAREIYVKKYGQNYEEVKEIDITLNELQSMAPLAK